MGDVEFPTNLAWLMFNARQVDILRGVDQGKLSSAQISRRIHIIQKGFPPASAKSTEIPAG
jgi:hypothetical protein